MAASRGMDMAVTLQKITTDSLPYLADFFGTGNGVDILGTPTGTLFVFSNPDDPGGVSSRVVVTGVGFQYDGAGVAFAGTINSVGIQDGSFNALVTITGLKVDF